MVSINGVSIPRSRTVLLLHLLYCNSIVSSFVIFSFHFVLYSVFRSFERGGVSEHKLTA